MIRALPDGLRSAVLLCAAVACACAARAADEPVKLRRAGGTFRQYGRENTWVQRWADVRNDTDSPRSVMVVFESSHAESGRLRYTATAEVPAGTTRRIFLAVRPARLPSLKQSIARGALFEETALLYDADTGRRLGESRARIVRIDKRQTVVASSIGRLEDGDSVAYITALEGSPLGTVARISSEPQLLPDRWYGYSVADVVILGGIDTGRLMASQTDALLDWVRRGGVLVLTGSTRLPDILSGPIGRAAGVLAAGVHRFTSLQVVQAAGQKPRNLKPVTPDWPAPMVELCVSGAEVLLTGNGLPLLTASRFGQGHVYVLAVPAGAIKDPSLHFLWRHMAPSRQEMSPVNDRAFAGPARDAVNAIAGRPAPPVTTPLIVLGLLAVVTVVLGAVLRLRRRGEILWMVLVPAALACSAALWGVGRSRSTREQLSHVSLLSGLGDGTARVQCLFGYYSGPDTRELTFSAGGPKGVIEDVGLKAQATFGLRRTQCGANITLPDRIVAANSTTLFMVDTVIPIPAGGITGSLTFGEAGLTGSLTNGMGVNIDSAVVYVNGQTYALGDLPAGKTTRVSLGADQHLGAVTFARRYAAAKPAAAWNLPRKKRRRTGMTKPAGRPRLRGRARGPATIVAEGSFMSSAVQDPLFKELVGRLLSQSKVGQSVDRRAVLIGYTSGGVIDPLDGRDLARRGKGVVVWPLSLSPPPPNSRVRLPTGFVDTVFTNMSLMVWDASNRRFNATPRDGEILVTARAPRTVGPLHAARAVLTVRLYAPGFRMKIWGVDQPTKARTIVHDSPPLKEVTNPAGDIEVVIDNADRFKTAGGAYAFSILVERIRRGAAVSVAGRSTWSFESIGVRLDGVSR